MKKTRVGIIGTGGISHCHMSGYKKLEADGRVEIVACCDIDEAKLNAYCDKYGVAKRYTDCREMMKNEQLDCVSVCTWNSAHKDKNDADIPQEEKDEKKKLQDKADELKKKMEEIVSKYASENKEVRQIIDLALLSNNMLKGEALSSFVKRSFDLLKK